MTITSLPQAGRLSIAIPVYNFGEFLPQTLDSIVNQAQEENVEVLVFDGGSTDDTRLISTEYVKRYSNFRYVRALNKGGIDADMSRSLDLTSSQYCWLFSGDDVMLPGAIQTVLKYLHQWQPNMILCRHNECLIDMEVLKDWPVLSIKSDRLFELNDPQDRRDYLEKALSSEAFFSFMGGLIVNRTTWFRGKLTPSFNGSNWAHVGRLWKLTEPLFKLGYVHTPLLNRRGGNDSFSGGGALSRLGIQINGLLGIIEDIYGENSFESTQLKRVLRNEVEPHWASGVRQDLINRKACSEEFTKLDIMIARIHDV